MEHSINKSTDKRNKPILAVDIDDVLAHLTHSLTEYHNENYSDMILTTDSFIGHEFHKVWGGTPDEAQTKMDAYFQSHHFNENLSSIAGAFEALSELKVDYELHCVTARQSALEQQTQSWINDRFPGIFTMLHFGNHFSKVGRSRSKAEICREIGAVLLIDDSIVYATQCFTAGIPVLLFGDYPWNQEVSLSYVDNWRSFQHFKSDTACEATAVKTIAYKTFVKEEHCGDSEAIATIPSGSGDHVVYRVLGWDQVVHAVHSVLRRNTAAAASHTNSTIVSTPGQLAVAAIQMCSVADKARNLATIRRLVHSAVSQSPALQLVCLPECCIFMSENRQQTLSVAENIPLTAEETERDGSGSVAALCAMAKEFQLWISVGGFPEARGDVDSSDQLPRMSNTHILINAAGEVVAPVYRKIHLFDSPLANMHESSLTVPGRDLVTLPVLDFRIGLAICYDLHFPAFFEALCAPPASDSLLSSSGGAEVVLVPSAFTRVTGQAHWEVLLRARAIENQCYVIAAAQSGQHNETRASHGHSMIVDPWGNIVSQLGSEDEGVCFAVIDKAQLQTVRGNMPVQSHKRPDLYGNTK